MANENAMYRFIAETLKTVGPRPSCSPSERALGRELERTWSEFCDRTEAESFQCAPHAFLGVIPMCAVLSLAGLSIVGTAPLWAAALGALSTFIIIAELLLYRELLDRWFPQRQGTNVIGTIAPTGTVQRRIVLTAHQDSAWEFNLWYWFKAAGVLVNVLGMVGMTVPVVLGLLIATATVAPDAPAVSWVTGSAFPFVALHLVFHTGNAVPGAMDDLAGIAVITELGRTFAKQRLEHTEVQLVACSAEECGLRGAKRFVDRHSWVLHMVPTYDINIDGVYDERHLTVITRELTTGTVHDGALVRLAESSAESNGRHIAKAVIPFGGTDAAAFAQKGIRTVALLCQDTATLAPNYHTRLDTLERVRPEALGVMHDVVATMSRAIDAGHIDSKA